jgi:8-oxo-dGTP pyrophosphatase MutT (NUDIX family)
MTDTPRQGVAVSGVVRDRAGRVLLVQTARRGWEPPGGKVEHGEDLIAALKREIAEESGCTVQVGRLVGVYSNLALSPNLFMLSFLCEHTGGDPCAGHECLDAGWFTPDEARRRVARPAVAARLADALADQPGVVYRAYATDRFTDPSTGGSSPQYYSVLTEHRC